jgi:Tfp pilus assembly protein PilO
MNHPKQGTWMVTVPVAALAAGYVYFFFLPNQKAIDAMQRDYAARQAAVVDAESLVPAIEAATTALEETRKTSTAWKDSAPSEEQLNELFGGITGLAKVAGTTPSRFEPQAVVVDETLQRVPVVLGCSGQFSQTMQFLRDLENLPQTIWVESGRWEVDEEGGDVGCELVLGIFADNSEKSDQAKTVAKPIKEADSSQ